MTAPPTLEQRLEVRRRPIGRSPVMYQSWRDLLFLHWELDPREIQDSLPPGLFVDTFGGKAYLGIVPFFMRSVRPRFLPAVPGISDFLETNVRTYVYDRCGRPGIWFYSLDANQPLAVRIARRWFGLPYFDAEMLASIEDGVIRYLCLRRGVERRFASELHCQPLDFLPSYAEDSLEFFLIERYLLFSHRGRKSRLHCGQVHHVPYPLRSADAPRTDRRLLKLAGFQPVEAQPAHIIFSTGVDVEVFGLELVPGGPGLAIAALRQQQ